MLLRDIMKESSVMSSILMHKGIYFPVRVLELVLGVFSRTFSLALSVALGYLHRSLLDWDLSTKGRLTCQSEAPDNAY